MVRYPTFSTTKSTLHKFHPLSDTSILTPSQLLREAFNQTEITTCKLSVHIIALLPIASYYITRNTCQAPQTDGVCLARTIPNSLRMSRFFRDTSTGSPDGGQSSRERECIPLGIKEASYPGTKEQIQYAVRQPLEY